MPIYEYECTQCGHRMEAIQQLSDPVLTDCPACGESALRKLISAAAFRLKGGGWYETDFKTGKKRNVIESEKAGEPAASAKGDSGKTQADGAPGGGGKKTDSTTG